MTVTANADGLNQAYGLDASKKGRGGAVKTFGTLNQIKVLIDTAVQTNLTAGTTGAAVDPRDGTVLPAGAIITKATFYTEVAFTGSSSTLDIGLQKLDGTELDYDGIDAAVALTAIDAVGEQVACDGALVGGVALTAAGIPYVKAGTAAFTAGRGVLVVDYKNAVTN